MYPHIDEALERTRSKIKDIFRLLDVKPFELSPDQVSRVVVVLGSSRSGSSLVFHLLSQSGAFWAPLGEETPFCRLAGFGWVIAAHQSDEIRPPVAEEARALAFHALINDLGRYRPDAPVSAERYLAQTVVRLLLQWPLLDLEPGKVIATLRTDNDGAYPFCALVKLGLDAALYDVPGARNLCHLQREIPELFLEEPPFILPTPRAFPTPEDLCRTPLLLKTSTNAYRIQFLKTLFPHSEFRWIVLARNPASSINGLIDGWQSNAFHAHNVGRFTTLKIKGYSETFPGGDRWWKFDLPPGWSEYQSVDLPEVCAFQWRSAYSRILKDVGQTGDQVLHVKCEDVLNPARGPSELERMFAFVQSPPLRVPEVAATRPVMASKAPSPARWRQREGEIWPLIQDTAVREIADCLGYDLSSPDGLL